MKLINTKLYMKDQDEVRIYIKQYLDSCKVKYTESNGCIISIKDLKKPLFVAHMDTVGERTTKVPIIWKGGMMQRETPAVLGGDDKAGVNLILNYCTQLNFVFTRDEEIGCVGSRALRDNDEDFVEILNQVPCAIQLDRKGSSDIIEYCDVDLTTEVIKACPGYRPEQGLYTDVTEWDSIVPAVNLSVGYYNPHMTNEYLNLEWYTRINSYILALDNIRGTFTLAPSCGLGAYSQPYDQNFMDYDDAGYGNYDFNKMYGYSKDHSKSVETVECDWCGDVPELIYEDADGYNLCEHCFCDAHSVVIRKNT